MHINCGELRADLMWEMILAKAFVLRRLLFPDLSDNMVTVYVLAHGRSGNPSLNEVLQKRASIQALSDGRGACTYTSTFFQPPDLGTRLTDDGPLLDLVIRPLSIVHRMLVVIGWNGWRLVQALQNKGWKAVIHPSARAGRKSDLACPRGRGYLQ